MPYRTCPQCSKGLQGVDGHASIILDGYPPPGTKGGPRFRCLVCNSYWRRDYAGQGAFDWKPEATHPAKAT